jgi:hypothetical protein
MSKILLFTLSTRRVFFEGVLIFGIIGTEEEHSKLSEMLGDDIDKCNGVLEITTKKG